MRFTHTHTISMIFVVSLPILFRCSSVCCVDILLDCLFRFFLTEKTRIIFVWLTFSKNIILRLTTASLASSNTRRKSRAHFHLSFVPIKSIFGKWVLWICPFDDCIKCVQNISVTHFDRFKCHDSHSVASRLFTAIESSHEKWLNSFISDRIWTPSAFDSRNVIDFTYFRQK